MSPRENYLMQMLCATCFGVTCGNLIVSERWLSGVLLFAAFCGYGWFTVAVVHDDVRRLLREKGILR